MLTETYSELYKNNSGTNNHSKKRRASLIINKILRECAKWNRTQNTNLVCELEKQNPKSNSKMETAEMAKSYKDFANLIQDSLFLFAHYGIYYLNDNLISILLILIVTDK